MQIDKVGAKEIVQDELVLSSKGMFGLVVQPVILTLHKTSWADLWVLCKNMLCRTPTLLCTKSWRAQP